MRILTWNTSVDTHSQATIHYSRKVHYIVYRKPAFFGFIRWRQFYPWKRDKRAESDVNPTDTASWILGAHRSVLADLCKLTLIWSRVRCSFRTRNSGPLQIHSVILISITSPWDTDGMDQPIGHSDPHLWIQTMGSNSLLYACCQTDARLLFHEPLSLANHSRLSSKTRSNGASLFLSLRALPQLGIPESAVRRLPRRLRWNFTLGQGENAKWMTGLESWIQMDWTQRIFGFFGVQATLSEASLKGTYEQRTAPVDGIRPNES